MRVLTEANCLEITGGLNLVYQDRSNEDGGGSGYGMPGVFLLDRWGDGGGSSGGSNIVDSSIYAICVGAYTSLGAWFGGTVGAGAGSALPVIGTVAGLWVGRTVGGGIGTGIGENICPKP